MSKVVVEQQLCIGDAFCGANKYECLVLQQSHHNNHIQTTSEIIYSTINYIYIYSLNLWFYGDWCVLSCHCILPWPLVLLAFSALMLLVRCQEGLLARKNMTDKVLEWLSSGAKCK